MGKKKGRQSGEFSSKSKRAVHFTEIFKNAEGDSADARCQRQHKSSRYGTSSLLHQRKEVRNERISIDFRHLRTLLQERRFEDQALRARLVTRAPPRQNNALPSKVIPEYGRGELKSEAGWILSYDHETFMANRLSHPEGENVGQYWTEQKIPSLQNISARILAPILRDYVFALGEDFVHQNIGMLPGNVISEISASCENITDDLAYVLGNHSHVRGLVLNCPVKNNDEERMRYDDGLTDEGLKRLIPQLIGSKWNAEKSVEDSWENLEFRHDNEIFSGCWNLRRLELHNHDTKSVQNLSLLLERCPQITHLCLNNSLNETTGPALLFHSGDLDSPSSKLDWGCINGGTLVDLLKNLQILDLSQCKWLKYNILLPFLRCIKASTEDLPLKMIRVAGCCPDLEEKVEILNGLTLNKPLISTRYQKSF